MTPLADVLDAAEADIEELLALAATTVAPEALVSEMEVETALVPVADVADALESVMTPDADFLLTTVVEDA